MRNWLRRLIRCVQGNRQSELELENLFNGLMRCAFRGELVPQDPNDEPASELLKRIKEERIARETKIEAEKRKSKENFS